MKPPRHNLGFWLGLFSPIFSLLLLNGFYNPFLVDSPVLYWSVEIFTWLLVPLMTLYVFTKRGGNFKDLGFSLPCSVFQWVQYFLLCFAAIFLFYHVYMGVQTWSKLVFRDNYLENGFNYGSLIPRGGLAGFFVLLWFSLTAGIVEELFFRSFIRRFFGFGLSACFLFVIVSSFLFSVIHWEGGIQNLIPTFAVGAFSSIFYFFYPNITVLMIAHTITDIIVFG